MRKGRFKFASFYKQSMGKMNHLLLLTITLLVQITLLGQSAKDIIQKSTHYFAITKEDSLIGDGAVLIKQKIAESQFFLIEGNLFCANGRTNQYLLLCTCTYHCCQCCSVL